MQVLLEVGQLASNGECCCSSVTVGRAVLGSNLDVNKICVVRFTTRMLTLGFEPRTYGTWLTTELQYHFTIFYPFLQEEFFTALLTFSLLDWAIAPKHLFAISSRFSRKRKKYKFREESSYPAKHVALVRGIYSRIPGGGLSGRGWVGDHILFWNGFVARKWEKQKFVIHLSYCNTQQQTQFFFRMGKCGFTSSL